MNRRAKGSRRGNDGGEAADGPPPAGSEAHDTGKPEPLTVTQLTRGIKSALKASFPGSLLVKAEISNYRGPHHSGHHYFRLKDAGAVIDAVMFANAAKGLKFKIEEGMEVLANGRVDVYEAGGKYNFVISSLSPVGTGALELAYRQVYAKLEAEGLFSAERKREIPPYPRTIALVTSKAAAGLADMLKVLRRFQFLRLIVVHVPVQGEGSAARIAAALDGVNKHAATLGGIDLILLGRGGGSYEDLFEFSREEVARAVGRSEIPIVTGIGHEVDVAIADLVADYHAHTPTEAATFAVRQWEQATELVEQGAMKLRREMRHTLQQAGQRLAGVERSGLFARPEELLLPRHQRLDDREQKLSLAVRNRLTLVRRRLDVLEQRLQKHDPRRVLLLRRDRLHKAEARLSAAMSQRLRRLEARVGTADTRLHRRSPGQRLVLLAQRLSTAESRLSRGMGQRLAVRVAALTALEGQLRVLGPESVLARGFTLTQRGDEIIRSPVDLKVGDEISTRFAGGSVGSKVTKVEG